MYSLNTILIKTVRYKCSRLGNNECRTFLDFTVPRKDTWSQKLQGEISTWCEKLEIIMRAHSWRTVSLG